MERMTRYVEMVRCPACGEEGLVRGLLGGACRFCGKTARDIALEEKPPFRDPRRRHTPEEAARRKKHGDAR